VCQNIDATTHAGTCCTRKTCGPTDTIINDGCGGSINCCAVKGQQYNATTMMCCTPGDPCATTYNGEYATGVKDGCGNLVNGGTGVCDCNRYGQVNPDPAHQSGGVGACCAAPTCGTTCDGSTKAATCNASVTVTCGASVCTGGKVCNAGMCCTPAACPNDGKYHAAFNPGCGLPTKVCDCNRFGGTPVDPDIAPTDGVPDDGGSCCANPTCPANVCTASTQHATCNPNVTKACGITCTGSKCCNGATCVTKNTCPAYPGCETQMPDGCGGTINCNCPSPATCSTATPGVLGTCNCPAVTCVGCNPATQTNGCGNSASCGCTGPQVCGVSNACCTPKTCADLPGGYQCGTVSDSACTGNNIGCPCSTAGKPLNACNGSTHQCECTPIKCCKDTGGVEPCIQPGSYGPALSYPDHNDGCGGSGTCSS
jgi:hypothetical protein